MSTENQKIIFGSHVVSQEQAVLAANPGDLVLPYPTKPGAKYWKITNKVFRQQENGSYEVVVDAVQL
ncbi:hypothetical protein JRG42_03115 [Pseudomonas granadensis]|uniref:Uncharacterized protein n=1 Tax=Pseudomonas granadensis TaxID=1421430 RepID=A0ABX7GF23_9PSED|nr:hypothetical protein [Pseudomonas granadensis]MBN6771770.1 hypothetical protein [Pseudomonas granadensis]MBN6803454.1 hypothetical protein [Pseudomonas granadensis]MBN6829621.1 hypothetical protein [Pseudomonas granadensis]MBN6837675.1 hypothetical protein [Pseudomonas granadensis]MBN6866321.1 hypothetical protein [Pseudomonas granadensis]